MSRAVAHGRPFTIDDLDQFPEDDGHRYELIEGSLLVTASPSRLHQRMCQRLLQLLSNSCPSDLEVLPGPVDVVAGPATMLVPDLLLVRTADVHAPRRQEPPPLLVVEVLSPSTRLIDLGTKRLAYRAGGAGAYWIADPFEPSVRVIRWEDDEDHEQFVAGDDTLAVDWPVAIEVCPDRLVSDQR